MTLHKDILICATDPEGNASIQVARVRLGNCQHGQTDAWLEAWDRGEVQSSLVELLTSEGFDRVILVDDCDSVNLVPLCLYERMNSQLWVFPQHALQPQHWQVRRQTA